MKINRIISAVLSITTTVGMLSVYPKEGNTAFISDDTSVDRLSATCDASVSYAIPDFKDLVGADVDEIGDISPVAAFGEIDENVNISADVMLRKVMAVEWDAAFRFERNKNENIELAVRYYCLDDEFASRMKFTELVYRMRGDADCNGSVDSSDASAVLAYYAAVSTGSKPDMTYSQLYGCDFNEDNIIDASDASGILNYYAMKSTGQL